MQTTQRHADMSHCMLCQTITLWKIAGTPICNHVFVQAMHSCHNALTASAKGTPHNNQLAHLAGPTLKNDLPPAWPGVLPPATPRPKGPLLTGPGVGWEPLPRAKLL